MTTHLIFMIEFNIIAYISFHSKTVFTRLLAFLDAGWGHVVLVIVFWADVDVVLEELDVTLWTEPSLVSERTVTSELVLGVNAGVLVLF